jgi:hypothetical protein
MGIWWCADVPADHFELNGEVPRSGQTMKRSTRSNAAQFPTVAQMVASVTPLTIAALCVVPALLVNVDWSPSTPLTWKVAPAALILGSALFVEAAYRARSYILSPLYVVLALLMMATNFLSAFNNATHRTGDRSDQRRGLISAAEQAEHQRSQWSQARLEAVKLVGETPVAVIRADIERAVSVDARRWQATGECDPLKTTAGASMTFCAQIASLRKQLGAAEQRDRIDAQLASLLTSTSGTATPATADPFSENLAGVLGVLGVHLSDTGKQMISTQRDLLLALCLELLATFGPTAALLTFGGRHAPTARPAARLVTVQAINNGTSGTRLITLAEPSDHYADFIAARLEPCEGASIRAGDAWELWLQWCADQDAEPGTQKRFGARMKMDFAHDKTNNRPRYLGVRAKRPTSALKIVTAA